MVRSEDETGFTLNTAAEAASTPAVYLFSLNKHCAINLTNKQTVKVELFYVSAGQVIALGILVTQFIALGLSSAVSHCHEIG